MSPILITLLVIAAAVTAAYILIYLQNIRNKKTWLKKLRGQWGKLSVRRRTAEEMKLFHSLYRDTKGENFFIDDITWRDLDMDRIFRGMDSTVSSAGSDVLYKLLRVPAFDIVELEKRDGIMNYFDANPSERESVLGILANSSDDRNPSAYSMIKVLDSAEKIRIGKYLLLTVMAAVDVALLFVFPAAAVIFFIILAAADLIIHVKNNSGINRYIKAFSCILKYLDTAQNFVKLKIDVLEPYSEKLEACLEQFSKMRRGSFLVTSSGSMGTGIGSAVLSYLNIFFHFDVLKYDQMLEEYLRNKESCRELIETLGFVDAMIAAASFRSSLDTFCVPEFSEDNESVEARGLYHLLVKNPVSNDTFLDGGTLVTGSNASGKSTFLKSVGIAAILAQSIYTVPAKYFRSPYVKVMSSMAVSDSLERNESYFMAELKSVKRIIDSSGGSIKVLAIVDEVLRGTNTTERIAASSEVLMELLRSGSVVLAATHDIELTYILEKSFKNVHFEETAGEDDIIFDYVLRDGRAESRNAVALMKALKFDCRTVEGALSMIEKYETDGKWEIDIDEG
ncbi:MAG: MutS-related protein [Lachnospiraceae bacterium]|jgi:DNA mismatch repair ATPase MutS